MLNKNIAIDGYGRAFIEENDLPEPGTNQVQVRMARTQISVGTEMTGVMNRIKKPKPEGKPYRLGYSIAGTVEKVGAKVTGFAPGDRVMAMGGGQANHALHCNVNQNLVIKIPDSISFEEGAYVALAITSMQAVRRLDPEFGQTYIIAGLGLVGQMAAQQLAFAGCNTVGLDIDPFRIDLAVRNGLDLSVTSLTDDSAKEQVMALTENDGVDGGIICFGGDGTPTLKGIYELMMTPPDTHRVGPIVVVGGCTFNDLMLAAALGNIDIRSAARTGPGYKDETWEQGQAYPTGWVRWDTQRQMRLFRDLLIKKRMDVASLSTHTFKLTEAPSVYQALADGTLKNTLGLFFEP